MYYTREDDEAIKILRQIDIKKEKRLMEDLVWRQKKRREEARLTAKDRMMIETEFCQDTKQQNVKFQQMAKALEYQSFTPAGKY